MHEIEAFHWSIKCTCRTDGACVIDENIYASKYLDGLLYCLFDLTFFSDVYSTGQCLSACCLHLFCGRVDCPREFLVRLYCLCCNNNICPVFCRSQSNRLTDPAASTRYE